MRSEWIVLAVALFAPTSASALCDCAPVTFMLGQPTDERLPLNPVLHVFEFEDAPEDLSKHIRVLNRWGTPLDVVWKELERPRRIELDASSYASAVVAVHALHVHSGIESAIQIVGLEPEPVWFEIDPYWRPSREAPRLLAAHTYEPSSCGESGREIFLSVGAGAFVVAWADSETRYRQGQYRTRIIPRIELWRIGQREDHVSAEAGRTFLGDPGCVSSNFEWPDGSPLFVGFAALLPDGSTTPFSANPMRLEPPDVAELDPPPR